MYSVVLVGVASAAVGLLEVGVRDQVGKGSMSASRGAPRDQGVLEISTNAHATLAKYQLSRARV